VDRRIGGVPELLGDDRLLVLAGKPSGAIDPPSSLRGRREHHLGAEECQHLAPLDHIEQHHQDQPVPRAAATKASAMPVLPEVGS
jgi:hypothetical protein